MNYLNVLVTVRSSLSARSYALCVMILSFKPFQFNSPSLLYSYPTQLELSREYIKICMISLL